MNEMFVKSTCFKQLCQLLLSLIVASALLFIDKDANNRQ